MDKTIVIGLGGTGLEAIRSLRRRVVESHGGLANLPHLGFLYIDTDRGGVATTEDNRRRWEILGLSVALDESEYEILETPEVGGIVSNLDQFPHISDWFPATQLRTIDQSAKDTPGARQIRPLGRLAFTLKTAAVETKFKNLLNRLPQASGGGKTQVYVVSSLSGGTGSGMFLDLAYRIREWTAGNCETSSFLVFPELTTTRGDRYLVNAYSALLELNYFSVASAGSRREGVRRGFRLPLRDRPAADKPFENCYIVGVRNDAEVELALDAVPEMIAHRIYLNFDSSFANDARALMNNGSLERTLVLEDPFNGNLHSQNFFTLGLSSIQFPVEPITEMIAYQLCQDLLEGWLKEREAPGNINERVQAMLPELRLTDDYLLGDRDLFGARSDYHPSDREVEEFVNEVRRYAPPKNILNFVAERQKRFMDEYRGAGVIKFFQDKRDNSAGAVQEITRLVRNKIAGILTDPALGWEFACKAIDETIRLAELRHKAFLDNLGTLPVRESGSRKSLNVFGRELTEAENRVTFRDRSVRETLQKVCEALKQNLASAVAGRSNDYGRLILEGVLSDLRTLRQSLVEWKNAVTRLRNDAENEVRRNRSHLTGKIANLKEFNGTVLFDDKRHREFYQTFDNAGAVRFIQEQLLGSDGDSNVLTLILRSDGLARTAHRAALDWLEKVSVVRVTDRNVADKLMEEYPDVAQRRHLLSQNYRKSLPFLVMDRVQKQIGGGQGSGAYKFSPTTAASVAGMLDDESARLQSVSEIRKDLLAATALPAASLRRVADRNQILFLQEVTAFPLRLIADMATLREQYRTYTSDPRAIPLHLQSRFDPPLMDLFLANSDDIREFELGEENFLLGRVLGDIRMETNRREMREEVRYTFPEAGGETIVRLGGAWDEGLALWLSDSKDAQSWRERLDATMRVRLKSLNTYSRRKEFGEKLTRYLDEMKGGLELGVVDPVYQRFDSIRKRVVRRWDLPVGEPSAAIRSDAELRFLRFARAAVPGPGPLPPAIRDMLERRREELRLSREQAETLLAESAGLASESREETEYRRMFEAFHEEGPLRPEVQVMLIERQVALDLDPERAKQIEAQVRESAARSKAAGK
jgi:hypothetical protein